MGIAGAYSGSTGVIYLSNTVAFNGTGGLVLLELYGHHIDYLINATDSPGDEGEYFAREVLGEHLTSAEINDILTENDHGTIIVDGQTVEVEFLFGWFTNALSAAWNGVKSGAGWVWSGATTAGDAIGRAAEATWDSIDTLANWVATGAEYYANGLEDFLHRDLIAGYQALNSIVDVLVLTGYDVYDGYHEMKDAIAQIAKGNITDGVAAFYVAMVHIPIKLYADAATTEILDVLSVVQTLIWVEPEGRFLHDDEMALAKRLFGDQWYLQFVRVKEGFAGLYSWISDRPFTNQLNIYLKTQPAAYELVMHELTHVWQFWYGGTDYKLESLADQYIDHAGYDWVPANDTYNTVACIDSDPVDFWPCLHVEQQGQFIQDAVDQTVGDCLFETDPSGSRIPVTPSEKDCDMHGHDVTGRLDRAIKDMQNGNYVPNTI